VLERGLPPAIFYNLLVSARAPAAAPGGERGLPVEPPLAAAR
jgi:hypothetical protein